MTKDPTPSREQLLRRFGAKLRQVRAAKGLSQESLAVLAGFSRSYYTEIETGKRNPSLVNIFRLAACLDVSPKELFDLSEEG